MYIYSINNNKINKMRYWHLLLDENEEVKEMYVTSKSTKDYGLLEKSKLFGWTYEVSKMN